MNERIQKLALQAEELDYETFDEYNHKTVKHYKFDKEKFAELIVQECAQAFEAEVDTWKEMDPYQGSMKRKGTQAIKEHFGVEE